MSVPVPAPVLAPMRWWHVAAVHALETVLFAPDCWSQETFWGELAQRTRRYYVVALAGPTPSSRGPAVEGYAGLAAYDEEAAVQTIAVAPHRQRTGLGRMLLRALLTEADSRGARTVGLEVRTDNAAAIALYESEGFHRLRVRRGYYQPSGGDALLMERRAGVA